MRKILTILIAILIGCSVSCYAQGKVTRQKKEKTVTQQTTPKKNKKKAQENKKDDKKNSKKEEPITGTTPAPSNYINGHEYVDLGLPSGTKWATCNVGASSPEEYGDYFAWGETKPKSSYTEENSLTHGKSHSTLQSKGIINSSRILNKNYDAASVNWGSTWRMPTEDELEELKKNCTWIWIDQDEKKGFKVIGDNGKSIFMPTAGYIRDYDNDAGNFIGCYWSVSVCDFGDETWYAKGLKFFMSAQYVVGDSYYFGFSIRPVSD